jgi:hypothetical protein
MTLGLKFIQIFYKLTCCAILKTLYLVCRKTKEKLATLRISKVDLIRKIRNLPYLIF